jgi:hypothetical protein
MQGKVFIMGMRREWGPFPLAAIEPIAEDWVRPTSELQADLVHPSGLQFDKVLRGVGIAGHLLIFEDRLLGSRRRFGYKLGPSYLGDLAHPVDPNSARRHRLPGYRHPVFLADLPRLELLR